MISPKISILLFVSFTWNAVTAYPSSAESMVVHSGDNLAKEGTGSLTGNFNDVPKITEMRILSNVSNRFAHTVVRSKVKNYANVSKETTFSIVLPESAYISGFIMEIAGKNYTAYVKEKEEAKKVYDQAVASGWGAAHVAIDTRDSNVFTVSVNVEPESKAVFYLTYEELLNRQDGRYELVINIRPGQPIKDLSVEVKIAESRPLKGVKAPPLRSGNEIGSDKQELDPRATIHIVNSTAAVVTFAPTIQRQKELAKYLGTKEDEGLAGQFVVQYDVERDPHGGEVLLDDGYFVHFFAPSDLEPLPKYVTFVLDTSGSMYDRKIVQLKEAMNSILEELKSTDKFSLVEFSTDVKVWDLQNSSQSASYPPGGATWSYQESNASLEEVKFPAAYSVNPENIQKAKSTVSSFSPSGGTNIFDALKVALHLIERERSNKESQLQPLIVFLTDGEPTVGLTTPDQIVSKITEFNSGSRKSVIFALSFGEGADKKFLQKLALHNSGFSKHIYEAADASLQLQGFYKTISSPLLANVTFNYAPTVTGVTKTNFPILFNGSEIVVAGRYALPVSQNADASVTEEIARPVIGWCGTRIIDLKPVTERPVTGLQRLWAYLTIKQLLEQKEIAKNPDELKKKALDLAISHSFVTPVSSLVVVKPNETKAVDTKSTSEKGGPASPLFSFAAAPQGFPGLPGPAAGFAASVPLIAPIRNGIPRRLITKKKRIHKGSRPVLPLAIAPVADVESATSVPFWTTPATFTQPPKYKLFIDIPWLESALDPNGLLKLPAGDFELGLNDSVPAVPGCSNTPTNATGRCTLLKDCATAPSFLKNLSDLLQYFCPLQKYAGVCCPNVNIP